MTLNRNRIEGSYPDGEPDESRDGSGRSLKNWFFFFLFLLVVTLVFGILVVRTAGFREIVAVKNEEWTQTRVSIQGSHMGWPCDIVLTGVAFPAQADSEKAALFIPEARAAWRPFRGLDIRLIRPSVRLIQAEPGVYLPEALARIGDLRNAHDVSDWLAPLKGRAALRIEQASLEVVSPAGERLRRLDSISLSVSPVALPHRSAVHFDLSAGPMQGPEGGYLQVRQEWLSCGESNRAEIAFSVDPAGQPAAGDYWKGVQP